MWIVLLPVSKKGVPEWSVTITVENTELYQPDAEHRRLFSCALQSTLEQKNNWPSYVSYSVNCPFARGGKKSLHQTRQRINKSWLLIAAYLQTSYTNHEGLWVLLSYNPFFTVRVSQDICWGLQKENLIFLFFSLWSFSSYSENWEQNIRKW